jgi:hypothetical protein
MYDKNKPLIVVSIIDNSNLCGGVDKKDLKNLNINLPITITEKTKRYIPIKLKKLVIRFCFTMCQNLSS